MCSTLNTVYVPQFPLSTFECVDNGNDDSDLLYTVQLGKKFVVRTLMHNKIEIQTNRKQQTPPSTYTPDVSQRLMKKRALVSQEGEGDKEHNEGGKDVTENVKRKRCNAP